MLISLIFIVLSTFVINGNCKAIQVFQFQKDGVPRENTVAIYKGILHPMSKLRSLTFCLRFKLYFFHASATLIKLEDTASKNDEMLVGIIWVDRLRTMLSGVRKFQELKDELQTNRWYHICFIYDDTKEEISSYVDGVINNVESYRMEDPCYGDLVSLGQGVRDLTDETSFSGMLTQVNIWDRPLSSREINDIANCLADLQGNYVSWDSGWEKHNIETISITLQEICDSKEHSANYFWFPDMPHSDAFYICSALGGRLPEVENASSVEFWHELTQKFWPGSMECVSRYWTPLTDLIEEGVWIRDHDRQVSGKIFWAQGEPDGKRHENCAVIFREGVRDVNCPASYQCAICQVNVNVVYTIRGTCEIDKRHSYFYIFQLEMGVLEFRGFSGYIIEKLNTTWVMKRRKNGEIMAELDKESANAEYPMGRRKWKLHTKICGQSEGLRIILLSPCKANEYTCDDGYCIPIGNRCDLKYDCLDHSDEFNCELLKIPEGYQNDLPPKISNYDTRSLPISINLTLESLTVETMGMTMAVSFTMVMTWFDYRLQFINLKDRTSLNKLTYKVGKSLWLPSINFVNTKKGVTTMIDADTQLLIRKYSNATKRDVLSPVEAEYFDGRGNAMSISRKYAIDFSCEFNLLLYPFDEQHCDIRMQITSASSDYVNFEMNTSDVDYLGNRFLLEYELEHPILIENKEGEFSELYVRIPMARRYGFAGLNIYTPSFILLVISYISLFFRANIFEVRIMSVLTVLLVTCTLFAQVAESLPKTSYFKIIDVWLFFCVVMNFLIIILHAFIDLQLYADAERTFSRDGHEKTAVEFLAEDLTPTVLADTNGYIMSQFSSMYGQISLKRTIIFSRVFVFLVFAVFCICYFGYIIF